MKHLTIKVTALLALLAATAPALAHSEAIGKSGIMALAHQLAHWLTASTWLPATLLVAFLAIVITGIIKRES